MTVKDFVAWEKWLLETDVRNEAIKFVERSR